jgi:hypothetical protein
LAHPRGWGSWAAATLCPFTARSRSVARRTESWRNRLTRDTHTR